MGLRAKLLRLRKEEGGSTLVEFAISFPVLLISTLLIFDIGLGVQTYSTLQHTANDTARFITARALDSPAPTNPTEVVNHVVTKLTGILPSAGTAPLVQFKLTNPSDATGTALPFSTGFVSGNKLTVTILHRHRFLLGNVFGADPIIMRGRAEMLIL